MADGSVYVPRLKTHYRETVRAAMKEEFGYKNDMMIPRLDKVVLNMGVGEAVGDSKQVKAAFDELMAIAGQQAPAIETRKRSPVLRRASTACSSTR